MKSPNLTFGFTGALVLLVLIALGEGWCIYDRWEASRAAAAERRQHERELAAMRDVLPPLTHQIAMAIEADLACAGRAVAAMQAELSDRDANAGRWRRLEPPAARADAYFDLATFVEETRELARNRGIEVRPTAARFGFSEHANEGPETERIEAVFRQRQVAQVLLEMLVESRPRALLSVKRAVPRNRPGGGERAIGLEDEASRERQHEAPLPDGPDFFAIDPSVSVRTPGRLETLPFRIEFIGQTETLRQFLNRLATSGMPILVREVDVEPAATEDIAATSRADETGAAAGSRAEPGPASIVLTIGAVTGDLEKIDSVRREAGTEGNAGVPSATPAPTPIVARPWSKFTVTVEFVELAQRPAGSSGPAKWSALAGTSR